MKLYWIAPRDVRKNRADPVRVMLDCSGFARLGVDVTLITPHVHRPERRVSRAEIWRQYGLRERFRIVELPTFYGDRSSETVIRAQKLIAGTGLAVSLAVRSMLDRQERLFVTHCQATSLPLVGLARLLPWLGWRTYLVLGAFESPKPIERWIARNVDGFLAGNKHMRDSMVRHYQMDPHSIWLQWPYSYLDAVDSISDDGPLDATPNGCPTAVYVGKVGYPVHDDIELLLETAALVPGWRLRIVGGDGRSERLYAERARRRGIDNVDWLGFKSLPELFPLIRSADLLLCYYPSSDPLAERNRIPAKFALYRCAARPIIAPDYPGIREILSDDEAFIIPPDRPEELARAMEAIRRSPDEAARRAERALYNARQMSLTRYCAEALSFMTSGPPTSESGVATHFEIDARA